MKKVNPFVFIKQHFYESEDGEHLYWVDEEDLETFKENFSDYLEEGIIKKTDERNIKGVEYNKWIVGLVFGDCEGEIVDEECPICQHLLVSDYVKENARYCSSFDCEYQNEVLTEYLNTFTKDSDQIKTSENKL